MVKIGFICEGKTETYLLLSTSFQKLLKSINLEPVNVIDADGCNNLLPHNIAEYINTLEKQGAEKIFILTDLDTDKCITLTKNRLGSRAQDVVIVAVKQIESWYLSCYSAMKMLLKKNQYSFDYPEKEDIPFQTINQLLITELGRGIGNHSAGKIKLASKMLEYGWSLEETAAHPESHSARYFLNKLTQAGN